MQLFPQYFTVRGIKELKMNSKERHELRYQRRKQRRLEKKNRYKDCYDYDKVFIAILNTNVCKEVKKHLLSLGIKKPCHASA